MAVRSLCRSISPAYDSLPVILPNRWLRLSFSTGGANFAYERDSNTPHRTHMYTTRQYMGSGEAWNDLVADYKPLWDIRRRSGAVVRYRMGEYKERRKEWVRQGGYGKSHFKEPERSELLVVGNPTQIKLAFKFLNEALDLLHDPGFDEFEDNERGRRNSKNPYGIENNEDNLIWQGYKRNFKGQLQPEKPRKNCYYRGKLGGNPCPLCQMFVNDRYNIWYTDIEMLNHFICPHTWHILGTKVTGLCMSQHKEIVTAVEKARSHGYLLYTLPLPSDEPVKHKRAGIPTDRNVRVRVKR